MQIWRSRAVGSSEGQVPQGWCHGPLGQVLSKLCVKTKLTQLHLQSSRTSWPVHGPGPAVCCHWLCGAHERSLDISLHPWQPWCCWAYLAELRQGFQPDHVPEGDCNLFPLKLTPFLWPGVPGCQSYWRHWDGLLSGQSPWRGSSGGYLFSTLYFYPMCKPVFLSGDERSERHCLFLPSGLPLCWQRAQERMGSSSGENHLLEKFLFSQKTVQNYIFCFSGSAENVF